MAEDDITSNDFEENDMDDFVDLLNDMMSEDSVSVANPVKLKRAIQTIMTIKQIFNKATLDKSQPEHKYNISFDDITAQRLFFTVNLDTNNSNVISGEVFKTISTYLPDDCVVSITPYLHEHVDLCFAFRISEDDSEEL